MAVSQDPLGMNARNFLYIRKYNPGYAKRIADDKLETKKILIENGLPTPDLIATFYNRDDIRNYKWNELPPFGFVIKPARGYGGEGILPIRKWDARIGKTTTGTAYTVKQLDSHIMDILEGAYSLQYLPDKAFIEERVNLSPFFKKLGSIGIADIRIIVFNHVPVMAMMRLPTEESGGKANLHLGALGIGIDIRTGITTNAILHDKRITMIPSTKIKTRGIKIPQWDDLLLIAAKTQAAIGLGYAGVDIVFDEKKGPEILEVNARPGLSIQNANLSSLRTRLERVENMSVPTPTRGVELAKSLFAAEFADKVRTGPIILSVIEPVSLKNGDETREITAKIDTGAYRTSIDAKLAHDMNLKEGDKQVITSSASGKNIRPTVHVTLELKGRKVSTIASVIDRSHMRYPMIVGRRDLKGFLVNPEIEGDTEEMTEDGHLVSTLGTS